MSLSGYGWCHDYEQHIEDRGTSIVLYMAPYAETTFISEEADKNIAYGTMEGEDKIVLDGETEYMGMYYPSGSAMEGWSLEKTSEGYLVTEDDSNTYRFDTMGRLTEICSNENYVNLIRTGNTMEIRDSLTNESLFVDYDEDGLITSISDGHGRTVRLGHNGENLTSITDAGGNTSTYAYNESHCLIRSTNSMGITYVVNTYDEEGRVLT